MAGSQCVVEWPGRLDYGRYLFLDHSVQVAAREDQHQSRGRRHGGDR